ncbi:LuxR family transcriptional regulator [Brevibacterium spongiae]|uniref:LuxR family transcriptional regulator n=1 Tax=Brevibacterium spongiae TaxID=2909672 RepID=A0ABY5SU86_9MICO|nr:LuxR family transcriptional regulator [Brevibacterium spongiae]UVI37769.1 LuxR family transcriptional regulator [Brevibacterium spongiae]
MTKKPEAQNLAELSRELLGRARGVRSGRSAQSIFTGTYLRQVLLTLTAGSELADHDSPPEATLQVVEGKVRMSTAEESWELSVGDHIEIPPQRHSVTALDDAAFILTIRLDIS